MRNAILLIVALAMIAHLNSGHWAMISALLLMILVHEFGHWFLARIFGFKVPVFSVGFGSVPRLHLGTLWETEFQITPWLFGGYVQIDPNDPDFSTKAAWKRALVLAGGVAMNVLTVVVIAFLLFTTIGERSHVPAFVEVLKLDTVNSIAVDAGMLVGDRILSVDGNPVDTPAQVADALQSHKDGTKARLILLSNGEDSAIDVVPDSEGRIGMVLIQGLETSYEKFGMVDGFKRSIEFTWEAGSNIVQGFSVMLGIRPVPENAVAGSSDVHGIVSIVQVGAMAFHDGLYSFAMVVCMISMNLAFFNILPIPMLDGGHLLFLVWEKLAGKPVSAETQANLANVFLFLFVSLMIFALFNDIFRPVEMA
jgi:regulator of sigma E protease